jgi:hypothetical protein
VPELTLNTHFSSSYGADLAFAEATIGTILRLKQTAVRNSDAEETSVIKAIQGKN